MDMEIDIFLESRDETNLEVYINPITIQII